jgi:adenylate cyclase
VPLVLRDRIIGVFGAVNRLGERGFNTADRRLLLAITSQVDTAIFESLDKQRLRETFRRYVGPRVMERMLALPERDYLKGERAYLTVLFTDMRGFTSIGAPVDVLVEMLNMHLGAMTEIVLAHEGTLDKFVADQVVAIFGAPLPMDDHALRAVQAAIEMQAVQQEQIAWWAERGYHLPSIGIGINTGEMIVGNIGCEQQMDYTVIGGHVNVASRLCDVAIENQTLVSETTWRLVANRVRANKLAAYRLHGIQEPVSAYEVLGLA